MIFFTIYFIIFILARTRPRARIFIYGKIFVRPSKLIERWTNGDRLTSDFSIFQARKSETVRNQTKLRSESVHEHDDGSVLPVREQGARSFDEEMRSIYNATYIFSKTLAYSFAFCKKMLYNVMRRDIAVTRSYQLR